MCVCIPHHVRVCGVGQSEGLSVVFLLQLILFGVELAQPVADLSALLSGLPVLWQLTHTHTHGSLSLALLQQILGLILSA